MVSVARCADWSKRERDQQGTAVDGWKDSATGRDTHGRKLYMTGKRVYYDDELCWFVITIHEHLEERIQRRKRW